MKEYTVSRLNNYIKNLISSDYILRNVTVIGEISDCKYHSMGHIYFTIKDEESSVPCVMFKGKRERGLRFKMETGQQIRVSGSIEVYERDGRYQLYANSIVLAADEKGKLFEEYEKLKNKLYEEGLFDFEVKKPIPEHPKKVGIVTASTGAAIQDIINVSRRRNPYVQLYLYPAKVQGEGAAASIVKGIEKLDTMGLDTIIIGRGGGSIEDLWAFNEEILARAIYAAKTPIISGTGHEIDNAIADYVADLRAPTPSAAAELAIDNVMETLTRVRRGRAELDNTFRLKYRETVHRLENLKNGLDKLSPEKLLNDNQMRLSMISDRLTRAIQDKFTSVKNRFMIDLERLNGLSPTAKLINGFGYISEGDKPVTGVDDVKQGDDITVTVHDGRIEAKVIETVKD